MQAVPFLRVGDPAVRLVPPPLYQAQWVRGLAPVYNEVPVSYVQRQSPVIAAPDELITYF